MSEMGGVPEVAGLRQDCVGVAISLQESAALADVYKVEKMHLLGAFIAWTSASRLLFRWWNRALPQCFDGGRGVGNGPLLTYP
jgi:hypothetical protein